MNISDMHELSLYETKVVLSSAIPADWGVENRRIAGYNQPDSAEKP
jgi:hypothetical protein